MLSSVLRWGDENLSSLPICVRVSYIKQGQRFPVSDVRPSAFCLYASQREHRFVASPAPPGCHCKFKCPISNSKVKHAPF